MELSYFTDEGFVTTTITKSEKRSLMKDILQELEHLHEDMKIHGDSSVFGQGNALVDENIHAELRRYICGYQQEALLELLSTDELRREWLRYKNGVTHIQSHDD